MLCVTKRGFYRCSALALVLGAGLMGAVPVQAQQIAKPSYRLAPVVPVQSNLVLQTALNNDWRPLGFSASSVGDDVHLTQSVQPVPGQGLAQWRTEEIRLGDRGRGAAVNALRLSVRALNRAPGGLVLGSNLGHEDNETQSFDVSYIRGWPSALMFKAGAYDLDFTPHAGLGLSDQGGSAEAGAVVRLGAGLDTARARQIAEGLGLSTVDGQSFGNRGRWYLFAAASGRAVGLNMTRDGSTGNLRGSGWSIDPAARIISDAQAGLGWRQGSVQASLGYLHRDIKNEFGVRGAGRNGDSLIALSFTVRPQQ